jgi:hypothetical protein
VCGCCQALGSHASPHWSADQTLDVVDGFIVSLRSLREFEDHHVLTLHAVQAEIIKELTDDQPIAGGARRGDILLAKIDLIAAIGADTANDRIGRPGYVLPWRSEE